MYCENLIFNPFANPTYRARQYSARQFEVIVNASGMDTSRHSIKT